ncbi:unnamed protein product [Prunus armeniaca]|uniref:Uncharacterized protein n=1 Tax=Prunus armeniaca TaxID=36596 RepID=A0A6J5WN60_PRUAR|nr:unnamed protein product [Prunus armeniaca]
MKSIWKILSCEIPEAGERFNQALSPEVVVKFYSELPEILARAITAREKRAAKAKRATTAAARASQAALVTPGMLLKFMF